MSADFTTYFTLLELGFIGSDGSGMSAPYVDDMPGKLEFTPAIRTRRKTSQSLTVASFSRRTGAGTVAVSGHWPSDFFAAWTAEMGDEGTIEGVGTDHRGAIIPHVCMTALVEDENGNRLYMAFPRTTVAEDYTRTVNNSDDEVAELDISLQYQPDEHGNGYYHILDKDMPDGMAETWMEAFDAEALRNKENT